MKRLWSVLAAGDRPYVVVVVAILAVAALMLVGPMSRFLDGRERLELLRKKHTALTAEIDRLEGRVGDLKDPEQIELIAREEFGFVKPGEIPYVVVAPEPERPRVAPAETTPEDVTWYRRLWRAAADLLPELP